MALIPSYEKKSKHIEFVGREDYIEIFNSRLKSLKNSNISVLNYYGVGGIGKSSLLKKLVSISEKNNNVININYNFDNNISKDKVYENIINTLGEKKVKLLYFGIAFSIYWSKINPNVELKKSHLPFLEEGTFLGDAIGTIGGLEALGLAGGILSLVDKNYKRFKDQYEMEGDKKEELDELKDKSAEDISVLLPKFLSYDLKNHINKNPNHSFLFFYDTYEVLWESVKKEHQKLSIDLWFRDLIIALNGLNTMFVIMGREKLVWTDDDPEWSEYISFVKLSGLDLEDSKKLLMANGIKDEQIISSIIDSSKGVPFYLSLAIDTYQGLKNPKVEDFEMTTQQKVVDRFLKYLDKDELRILDLLCVTRFFTDDLLESLKDEFISGYLPSSSVLNYSFISEKDGRYYMHKLMQNALQNNINDNNIKKFHEFLFKYYDKILSVKETDSSSYTQNLKEAMYHYSYIADDNSLIKWFNNSIEKLRIDGAYSMIISVYDELTGYLKEQENQNEQLINLGLLYIKIEDLKNAKKIIDGLSNSLNTYLLNKFYYLQATYFDQLKNYKGAEIYYERAIKYLLNDEEMMIDIYISLGNIYRKNKDYSKSIHLLSKAKELVQNNSHNDLYLAKIYDKFGYMYQNQKKYDKAQEMFLKSLHIKQSIYKDGHIEIAKIYMALSNLGFLLKQTTQSKEYIDKTFKSFMDTYGLYSSYTLSIYKLLAKILIADDSVEEYVSSPINRHIDKTYLYATLSNELYRQKDERADRFLQMAEESATDDYELIKLYELLYILFFSIRQNKKIEKYMIKSVDLLKKTQEYRKLAKLYGKLGKFYKEEKKLKLSEQYYQLQCEIYEQLNDQKLLAGAYGYFADFYIKIQNSKKAESFYIKQYKVLEKTRDVQALSNAYKYIAVFYFKQKDYISASKFYHKRLDLWKKELNHHNIIESYEDLRRIYKYCHDRYSQLYFLQEELRYSLENTNHTIIDTIYGKLADYYNQIKDISNAEKYYLLQLKVREQDKSNPTKLAKGYSFLAKFYRKNGELEKAKENVFKQLEVIKTTNDQQKIANSYDYIISFYESLFDKKKITSDKKDDIKSNNIIKEELKYRLIQYQIRVDNNLLEDAADSCKGLASCYNKLSDQKNREKYLLLRVKYLENTKARDDLAQSCKLLGYFYKNKKDMDNAKKYFVKYLKLWNVEKDKEEFYQKYFEFFQKNKQIIRFDDFTKDKIIDLLQKDDYKTAALYISFLSRFYKNRKKELFGFFKDIDMKIFEKDIDKQLSAFRIISITLFQQKEVKVSSYFFDKLLSKQEVKYKDDKNKLVEIYENGIMVFQKRDEKNYLKLYSKKLEKINPNSSFQP